MVCCCGVLLVRITCPQPFLIEATIWLRQPVESIKECSESCRSTVQRVHFELSVQYLSVQGCSRRFSLVCLDMSRRSSLLLSWAQKAQRLQGDPGLYEVAAERWPGPGAKTVDTYRRYQVIPSEISDWKLKVFRKMLPVNFQPWCSGCPGTCQVHSKYKARKPKGIERKAWKSTNEKHKVRMQPGRKKSFGSLALAVELKHKQTLLDKPRPCLMCRPERMKIDILTLRPELTRGQE